MAIGDFPDRDLVKGFMARNRLRPRDPLDIFDKEPHWCAGCHKITELRECWGCKKWFCYECLIEHMMGCKEWQKVKGDYGVLFECDKHETCDDCPYRFKCYTSKKILKKGNNANL